MLEFLRSEEGGFVEWIIGALIIGIGCLPIALGIGDAIIGRTTIMAHQIGNIVWSDW